MKTAKDSKLDALVDSLLEGAKKESEKLPTFSLCFTSVRKDYIRKVYDMWMGNAVNPEEIEFICCIDKGQDECLAEAKLLPNYQVNGRDQTVLVIQPDPDGDCVKGWNVASFVSRGGVLIAVADDFVPPPRWDEKLIGVFGRFQDGIKADVIIKVADGYNTDIATLGIMTRTRYNRFGYFFYPGYQSLFCLPEGTPIYMANQTFKPIEDIEVGDVVVGSERRPGKSSIKGQKRDFLAPSKVTAVHRKLDQIVRVTLASGKVIRCTEDHVWAYYGDTRQYARDEQGKLVKNPTGTYYRETRDGSFLYAPAKVGRQMVKVFDMPEDAPNDAETARDLGWLAGMYDGEGSFPVITQSLEKNPETCAELERVLTKAGIQWTQKPFQGVYNGKTVVQNSYCIVGGRPEYLKFLSWTKPMRTFKKQVTKRMFTSRYGTPDEIVSIEPEPGICEVYCITTETGNFVANGYLSHNCDTEYTQRAIQDNAICNVPELMFEHLHPDANKRPRDDADNKHASKFRWDRGELLFNWRKARGFPTDRGSTYERAVRTASNPAAYVAYLHTVKDDFCLGEVCQRLLESGVQQFRFIVPTSYWGGQETPQEDIDGIVKVASTLPNCKVIMQKLDDLRPYAQNRTHLETMARNQALHILRQEDFDHVLVVDSDELWRKTLLGEIMSLVNAWQPCSIRTGMVPVVGVPGVPVGEARDRVTVYQRADCNFQNCRTPYGFAGELGNYGVFHFTATRRTMDEVVKKMRDSGHYGDKDYDFEGFIGDKLKRVKPGMRDIHFYKHDQIWPYTRDWLQDEWDEIPDSIKPHLSQTIIS